MSTRIHARATPEECERVKETARSVKMAPATLVRLLTLDFVEKFERGEVEIANGKVREVVA